jgi:DNA-binding CsgD family transcriptional regulator
MAEEVALARDWGAASVLGRTLRSAGELGGPGSEEMLREAVELLTSSVARYELGRAQLALGRVIADQDERVSLLRAALDLGVECGSPALYREAAAELKDSGVDLPSDVLDGVWVTTTERRIAELASAGGSPSAIAQELFLTPAGVESTLAELRERLGVGSDEELAGALPAR